MSSRRSAEPEKTDKRKQRALNSCLPCRQRKVKCDQHRPCSGCAKRGTVNECISTPARANDAPSSITSPSSSSDPAVSRRPSSLQITSPTTRVHEDVIRPTIEQDARERPSLLYDDVEELKVFELSRTDIMELWQTFTNRIQLLTPALLETERVEEWMVQITLTSQDSSVPVSPNIRMDQLVTYLPSLSHGSRGLLLAVLAAASQFSSKPYLRQQFTQRALLTLAFRAVRLSNYLRNPTIDSIQALLLVGIVLQNDRACQGAWCLLGTTIRLAESIGVNRDLWPGAHQGPDLSKDIKCRLLYSLASQDCLLSMCLGRVPSLYLAGHVALVPGRPCDYPTSMILLTARLGTSLWSKRARHPDDFELLLKEVQEDSAFARQLGEKLALGAVTFKSSCLSTAFAMHSSFAISYICRPALKYSPHMARKSSSSSTSTSSTSAQQKAQFALLEILKSSLVAALKNYVYLTSAWEYTIRSWSVAHSGLGAALMLGTLGEFKEESIRTLAGTVIETLENRLEDVAIVSKGSKALDLLRGLYKEATGGLGHDPRPPTLRVNEMEMGRGMGPMTNQGFGNGQQGIGSLELDGRDNGDGIASGSVGMSDTEQQLRMAAAFEAPFLYQFAEPTALDEFDSLFTDGAQFGWGMDSWDGSGF